MDGLFLYLVQLYPDRNGDLLKVGISGDPDIRAGGFKTLAPHLKLVGVWRILSKRFEKKALKELVNYGARPYGGEVVELHPQMAKKVIDRMVKRLPLTS